MELNIDEEPEKRQKKAFKQFQNTNKFDKKYLI